MIGTMIIMTTVITEMMKTMMIIMTTAKINIGPLKNFDDFNDNNDDNDDNDDCN